MKPEEAIWVDIGLYGIFYGNCGKCNKQINLSNDYRMLKKERRCEINCPKCGTITNFPIFEISEYCGEINEKY